MDDAKVCDRLVASMERNVWPSSKPGCLASNFSLHHVDRLEREEPLNF